MSDKLYKLAKLLQIKLSAEKTNIPQQKLDFYQNKLSFKIKSAKELSNFEIDLLMKFTWGNNSGSMMSHFLSKLKTNKDIKAYVCICYDNNTNKTIGWSLAELRMELADEDFDTIYMFKKLLKDINLVCHKFNNSEKQIATLFHQNKFKEAEKEINEIINYMQTNNFEKDERFFENTIPDFIYYANCFLDILKNPDYNIIYNTYVKKEYRNRRIGASLIAKLKDFISSKKFNIIETIVSNDFEETPFATTFYEKSIGVKKPEYVDHYNDYPYNDKQLNLFSKIKTFFKIAGLTLSDDLANHIYVNNILQNLPKDHWPEVYVNYGIEGVDNAIKYGTKALITRLKREIKNFIEYDITEKIIEQVQSDLQIDNLNINSYLILKNLFIEIGYDEDYRKPWLTTIDRLIDLIKDKKELQRLIASKADPKEIFDKKVELNLSLNMFYDSSHSNGSFLEHMAVSENKHAPETKKLLNLLDSSRLSSPADVSYMTKQHIENPGKYKGHSEYTGHIELYPDTIRANKELEIIRITQIVKPYIKIAEVTMYNTVNYKEISKNADILKTITNRAFYNVSYLKFNNEHISPILGILDKIAKACDYLLSTLFEHFNDENFDSRLTNDQNILTNLLKQLKDYVDSI